MDEMQLPRFQMSDLEKVLLLTHEEMRNNQFVKFFLWGHVCFPELKYWIGQ